MVTAEQLKAILPTNTEVEDWLPHVNEMLVKYEINTPLRVAAFLAQTAHESSDWRKLEENLRYTAKRLVQVWPKRFNATSAKDYAYNPEKLANKVYSSRMGNGNEASGDGWLFRGRGIKQLTGRHNYTEFGEDVGMTAEEAVAYVETKRGAVESAAWFWKRNELSKFADEDDNVGLTRRINGGTIGLSDRNKRYAAAKEVLATLTEQGPAQSEPAEGEVVPVKKWPVLRQGSKGPVVAQLQEKLGFSKAWIDGHFGVATRIRVIDYQRRAGLVADGVAGNTTLTHMFGPAT